jgi:hypothetical protein
MLSGKHPHPGDSYNAVLFHLLTQTPVDLGKVAPDCPLALRRIVERCLKPAARERFATAKELALALETVQVAEESGASKHGEAGRGSAPRVRASAAGVLGLAAVGAAFWLTSPQGKQDRADTPTAVTAHVSAAVPAPLPVANDSAPEASSSGPRAVLSGRSRSPEVRPIQEKPPTRTQPVSRTHSLPEVQPSAGPANSSGKFVTRNPYD